MQHGPWVLRMFVVLHDYSFVSKSVMMESCLLWANDKNIMHRRAGRLVALDVCGLLCCFSLVQIAMASSGADPLLLSSSSSSYHSLLELPSSSSLNQHHDNDAITVVRCGCD